MKNIKFYLSNLFLCTTILTYTNHAMENNDAMDIDSPSSSHQTPKIFSAPKRKFDEQEQGDDVNAPATKRPRLGDDTPSLASMQQTPEELTNERILIDKAYKGLVKRTAIKINQSNLQAKALQDHKHAWFVLMEIRDKYLDSTQFDILFKDIKEKAIEGTADYTFRE